jgi:hypothetical protein
MRAPSEMAAATRQDWCSICAMTLRSMTSFPQAGPITLIEWPQPATTHIGTATGTMPVRSLALNTALGHA